MEEKTKDKVGYLKISEFAKLTGLSEQCLRDWDNNGKLKCHHKSVKGGYRYYTYEQVDAYLDKAKRQIRVVGYCRASKEVSDDIKRQESVIYNYISKRDINIKDFVMLSEVSDGISGGKELRKLIKDISDNLVKEIIVEDATRLSFLDFELINIIAKAHDCKITVLNDVCKVPLEDAVKDVKTLLDVIDSKLGLTKEDLKSLLCDIIDTK